MSIPRVIHFTWKTKTLTRFAQRIWAEWEKTHPEWELKLWDDEDIRALVDEHYPEHLATFDAYPSGIFRADAFRFFVLHKFGGIYADLDVQPLGDIGELIGRTECFVGAEPEKHVRENDARYRGMPFSLCNAFMGSVPGHVFWQRCMEAMARCLCPDVVDATGPRFINGVALTIPREERPDVLPPSFWSPLAGDGRAWPTPEAYNEAMARHFTLVGRSEPALVSHLWRNSWFMPIFYKGPSFWKVPNQMQWAWRRVQAGEMGRTRFAAPSVDYDQQRLPEPQPLPRLFLALDVSGGADKAGLTKMVEGLDYPRQRLAIDYFEHDDAAERHNAMLDAGKNHDGVVLIDGRVTHLQTNALREMVRAQRPVVGLSMRGADGSDRNESAFLYHRDVFKHLYRNARETGAVMPVSGRDRLPLENFRYLNVAPLTAVGADVMLVRREVMEAGVRFASAPYKYHLDAEAFCIAARDKGFEVCALPNVTATTGRARRD